MYRTIRKESNGKTTGVWLVDGRWTWWLLLWWSYQWTSPRCATKLILLIVSLWILFYPYWLLVLNFLLHVLCIFLVLFFHSDYQSYYENYSLIANNNNAKISLINILLSSRVWVLLLFIILLSQGSKKRSWICIGPESVVVVVVWELQRKPQPRD